MIDHCGRSEMNWILRLRLLPSFKAEGGKLREPADVSSAIEPLEEAPQETEGEKFGEPTDLFPTMEIEFRTF